MHRRVNTSEPSPRRREKEVRDRLDNLLSSAGVWLDATSAQVDEVDELLTILENLNAVEYPTRSAKLWGRWRLVWSNSPPVLRNKGVTGLGSLPFVQFQVPNCAAPSLSRFLRQARIPEPGLLFYNRA